MASETQTPEMKVTHSEESGVTTCIMPTDYTDGYRVTVGWSADDDAWIARLSGSRAGDQIGHGDTKEEALLSLACSLGCCIDALYHWRDEDRKNSPEPSHG